MVSKHHHMVCLVDRFRKQFPECAYNTDVLESNIIVSCPTHGVTNLKYGASSRVKYPCKRCGIEIRTHKLKYTDAQYIELVTIAHNNRYTYIHLNDEICAVCDLHGQFLLSGNRKANHLNKLSGCPACARATRSDLGIGGFNKRQFDHHPELKDLNSSLYIIKCSSDTEQFIKIGITTRTIEDRFKYKSFIKYQYDIIGCIDGKLIDMFNLEQSCKKSLNSNRYRPTIKFPGYTECFNVDALRSILTFVGITDSY
jgi:hypothetical protein